jgi:hypothetical protein
LSYSHIYCTYLTQKIINNTNININNNSSKNKNNDNNNDGNKSNCDNIGDYKDKYNDDVIGHNIDDNSNNNNNCIYPSLAFPATQSTNVFK